MSCLGMHFALDAADESKLLRLKSDDERLSFIVEQLEERLIDTEHACQTDKAWDAIHRCFDSGKLTFSRTSPLHMAILGGAQLLSRDDYIASYKPAASITAIAKAITSISEAEMRDRYYEIDPHECDYEINENDWRYTWDWFTGVQEFYRTAAANRRAVIFTVDQ